MQRFLRCIFLFAAILCSTSAFAQKQFGSTQGTVRDAEGQPIPGVSIAVSSESRGTTTVYTDRGGRYRIESLIPGPYNLEAQLLGFQSVLKKDVRISVGSISTVDFVLELEKVAESVTVQEEAPQIDSTTTAISYAIPSEIVQGLPELGLSYLLSTTPGVGDDRVAYGASNTNNRIWIDGVDTSNRSNGGIFLSYNYNWIEQGQVLGNGAPAEYGNFLGVVGNFVTRSGSNQFHGLFETFFFNENLVSTNVPDPRPENPFKTWDLSAQIGGPIARDKLWFFSGFQYPHTETIHYEYDGVETTEFPKLITKLTYKPNQNNTIQGLAHYSHSRHDGEGAGSGVLPEVTRVNTCHEGSWNATWISLLTEATTLEGRFGGFWNDCEFLPRNGDTSAYFNYDTGVLSRNAKSTERHRRFQPQGNLVLTHHAEDYLGSHEFKFGAQFQNSNVRDEYTINGRFYYTSYTHSQYGLFRSRESDLQETTRHNGDIDQLSLYVHDRWNLNARLALSLGLRWDHGRGSTDRGVVLSADPVAPRIGLIWKLRDSKPIVIKVHYGDYYDAVLTRQFILLSDQPFGLQIDDFDNDTQQWVTIQRDQNLYFSAPDNKHPFVRQFTFGLDQELPAGITMGAHYIYRKWHNILEDVDTHSIYEPVPFPNPVTGEIITVYNRLTLEPSLLTNPEGLFRRYDGVEVSLNRQFRNDLALSASFVYSKIRGNIQNVRDDDFSSFSPFLNDPNQLINFNGHLVNDPTFEWKFSGIYNLPYGMNLGFFFRHHSGDTWAPLVSLPRSIVSQEGEILGLPLGSYRLPSQNILDLRVEKQFPISHGQFRITADIFNVLNAATVNEVEVYWDQRNYGEPTSFVAPRQIRLGLRYTF